MSQAEKKVFRATLPPPQFAPIAIQDTSAPGPAPCSEQKRRDSHPDTKKEPPTAMEIISLVSSPNPDHDPSNPMPPPPPPPPPQSPAAVPPSGDKSIIRQLRRARSESEGLWDFLKKVVLVLVAIEGTICIVFLAVIDIAMFFIGSIYFRDCPLNSNIPLYLLIGGLSLILKNLVRCIHRVRTAGTPEREEENKIKVCLERVIDCFFAVWFILGSYWVYSEYEPNYDPAEGLYCNKTLYLFAFWQITSYYIIFSLGVMVLCCLCICALVLQ